MLKYDPAVMSYDFYRAYSQNYPAMYPTGTEDTQDSDDMGQTWLVFTNGLINELNHHRNKEGRNLGE